jgi:Lon protease-like protein
VVINGLIDTYANVTPASYSLGMFNLPLFPLNTVLFPRMPISLHIFEDRYKQMMQVCLDENRPFGVVLISSGQEVGEPATPQAIGCTAEITNVQKLSDGRLNLVAIGQQRFQIQTLDFSQSYLMGSVEALTLTPATAVAKRYQRLLRQQIQGYMEQLSLIGEVEFNMAKLPTDVLDMAYLAATMLQMPNDKKQALLAINEGDQLVARVYDACREETAVLKAMISAGEPKQAGPFSLN